MADIEHVKFTLRVMDHDDIGSHDHLGDLTLDLAEILKSEDGSDERVFRVDRKWFPLR